MNDYKLMRSNVNQLGQLLGQTIEESQGQEILDLVEQIRTLSKQKQSGDQTANAKLFALIKTLNAEQLLLVARAFNQFLNLVNTADEHYGISPHGEASNNPTKIKKLFEKFKAAKIDPIALQQTIQELSMDLVLTAHPTEINRRTMINTYSAINHCLVELDHDDLADYEKDRIFRKLRQLICQAWNTEEIRHKRPTPVDEAKWGFSVVESSLWQGVPLFMREFNDQLRTHFGQTFNILSKTPIKFSSWMGGDRDGNPNVTAQVTKEVIILARAKAASLFLSDIQILIDELSMSRCSDDFKVYLTEKNLYDVSPTEPYRALLKQLRHKLRVTYHYFLDLSNKQMPIKTADLILHEDELLKPLYACYHSLVACGMSKIAQGSLFDTLTRLHAFGMQLLKLDVRQDSSMHSETLNEITQALNLGSYLDWDETQRQAFLLQELASNRPLLPYDWQPTKEATEVLETCKMIAESEKDTISVYVISMAKMPSDVLAVLLLLKIAGNRHSISIVPLFETLEDLEQAESVMQALFAMPLYRNYIQNKQMVMIGYSDSAKDAGILAASWAQYKTQENLLALCQKQGIELTLFHGRGGSVGRGGAPAHAALLSQPPGSLKGGLRVTEQGEMIRFKFGLPEVTLSSLMLYASAILQANLLPPPNPKPEWRLLMDKASDLSCAQYRSFVQQDPAFVSYFKMVTPEQELSLLPLGSRPAKRKKLNGIDGLRAIPWIFAWTQNRFIVPSWLGAGFAIQQLIEQGNLSTLQQMNQEWSFFNARLDMLEMVYAKCDFAIFDYYQQELVEVGLHYFGTKLAQQLKQDIQTILSVTKQPKLMENLPWIMTSIHLRNRYIHPLNLLQVELLKRFRLQENQNVEDHALIEQALMITISGIAAGMRNSG